MDTLYAISLAISVSQGGADLPAPTRLVYAAFVRAAADESKISPYTIVAVVAHESKWKPQAVLQGCTKGKRRKGRICNRDGREDVGLCQLHMADWQVLTREQALDPWQNLRQCARELRKQKISHRLRRCDRESWTSRWPWAFPDRHGPLQHHNMGSKGYGERVERRRKRIKWKVRRILRGEMRERNT